MEQTIARLSDEQVRATIRDGIAGTRMASFRLSLTPEEIASLASFIRAPAEVRWTDADLTASRRLHEAEEGTPLPDVSDITAVVERGTGNVLFVVDHELVGEIFFPNVHGGLKYVGDRLFIPARTGFIARCDLPTLRPEVTVRVGIYLRNMEVSDQGILAVTSLPPALVFLDHDLNLKKSVPLEEVPSTVVRLDRTRFLVTFLEAPRMLVVEGEEIVREIPLTAPYKQCSVVAGLVLGTNGSEIFASDLNREVKVEDAAIPHLAAGDFWPDGADLMWATPKIGDHGVTVYRIGRPGGDAAPRIERVAQVEAEALPVRGHSNTFVRTHPALDFVVTTSGTDVLIIGKKDLAVRRKLTPQKGKMALHTEFSRDGSTLFVSVWDERGGIHMYSTADFSLRGVIPASKPAGQYNRFMKSWRN